MKDVRLALVALLIALTLTTVGCSEPDRPSISLFLAVQRGDLDQLERHIYWGTDINAALPNGEKPLQTAAANGRIIMVRTLLKHGAELDTGSPAGDTALDLAILNGRTQIAELLLAEGARLDASALLLKAAAQGVTDRDSIRFLIDHGADTERRNAEGDTPLLIAIRQDNHRLATHLVGHGADVNAQTADGESALALARRLQVPELISLLQRQGAR
ncbi:MAG: ankyrin repeat domain-containing protein [Chromatiaceae bacterium]|nr:ankyrin repeat domain-containing protein [Gammaproteobacteria bacterium]MCP5305832.1 ankyrin repeat domain-containing protein [Chromatiaceae bacterium]MCP5312688.1 ankyrin repeat domain-containing protein [Chromatiaceae bacterium]